jgi:hypothetical protein
MKAWPKAIDEFFFNSNNTIQIRLFRLFFGLTVFYMYCIRSLDLGFFYSNTGIMPVEFIGRIQEMSYRFTIFKYFSSDLALWIGNSIFLASLFLAAIGVFPRIFSLIAFFLHISFIHRNIFAVYGADFIASCFLLYLCFMDTRPNAGTVSKWVSSMFYRIAQLHVCIIYFFAGTSKLQGKTWWNGEALWGALANPQQVGWDFSWTVNIPLFIVVGTYLSLLWEIYFPALVWVRPLRYWFLAFGLLLHLLIAIMIQIPFFGALMAITYILFLDDTGAKKFDTTVQKFFSRVKVSVKISDPNRV